MKLLVIGGGPFGLNAALQARELGAEVTLIERKRIGGTSRNDGIPVTVNRNPQLNAHRRPGPHIAD